MSYKNSIPFFPNDDIEQIIGEVRKVLSGEGFLTKGPKVKEFEKAYAEYTKTKFAISTNSCTTALEVVLKSIGLKSQDEVIVPAQTFVATGSSVLCSGGKLVFCDSDDNFLFDFDDLKKKITSKTKAVIIVHFAGLIHPDIFKIRDYLKQRNIFLIEDCAHSNGASIDNIFAGNIGDFGCHSFYSTKIITTGEGGMITTNSEEHFYRCSSIRSIGIDIKSGQEIFNEVGSNFRMAEFESILGLSQLKRLDEFVERRIHIGNIYKNELKQLETSGQIRFQDYPLNIRHPFWKFIIFIKSNTISRDFIKNRMLNDGINIDAPYSPLMHLQPVFKRICGTKEGDMPKAESLSNTHFCLPMHVQLSEDDACVISKKLIKAFLEC